MLTHKWLSNCLELQETIPKIQWGIQKEGGTLSKALGVAWDNELDILTFSNPNPKIPDALTKRDFLRRMAQLFDPLGLLAPFVLGAKLIIQDMWLLKIPWDEPINGKIHEDSINWLQNLDTINQFKIPRYL